MALAGCSATPQTKQILASPPPDLAAQQELQTVPFFPQEKYQCGPAALATVLSFSGLTIDPQDLVPKVYVPDRQGSFQVEMMAATRSLNRIPLQIDPTLASLLAWVDHGQPVLTLQNLGLDWYPNWHYAVVVGYDLDREQIIMRSGTIERYVVKMPVFERTWRRSDFWAMVSLTPGVIPLAQNETRYFQAMAGYEKHAPLADVAKAWQVGLSKWPSSVQLHMGYGNHLYRQGKKTSAEAEFREAISLNPAYGPAYNNLAQIRMELGDYQQAIKFINKAIEVDAASRAFYERTLRKAQSLKESASQ